MKKLLLSTLILLFFVLHSEAQITITQSDFAAIGDTVLIAKDTTPAGISVGSSGMQSWDFSSLQMDELDVNAFIDPSTTYADSSFPNSTIASDVNSGTQVNYGTVNANFFNFDGFWGDPLGVGIPVAVAFNPPSTRLVFPAVYNSSFQDTSHFDFYFSDPALYQYGIDSIWISHTSYSTRTMDAYGQMITPADTFDCLRQLSVDISIDTIYWHFLLGGGWAIVPESFIPPEMGYNSNPSIDTAYSYFWFAGGGDMQVAEATVDTVGGNVLTASFKVSDKVVAGLFAAVNPSCVNVCDGSASVNPVSGYQPYSYLWDAGAGNQTTQIASGLCSGTYSVTVSDAMGNSSSALVAVTELSYQVTVSGAQCDTCANGSASISTWGGAAPYSYAWSNGGNTETVTGLLPGTYMVTVSDVNSCNITDTITVTGWPSGIAEVSKESSVKIFPNPSKGNFTVKSNNGLKSLTVFNLLGEKVFISEGRGFMQDIDLSFLQNGTYFLLIENAVTSQAGRIFIQK